MCVHPGSILCVRVTGLFISSVDQISALGYTKCVLVAQTGEEWWPGE